MTRKKEASNVKLSVFSDVTRLYCEWCLPKAAGWRSYVAAKLYVRGDPVVHHLNVEGWNETAGVRKSSVPV
jgi:hypothetical protein